MTTVIPTCQCIYVLILRVIVILWYGCGTVALFGMRAMELTLPNGVRCGDGGASIGCHLHSEMGVDMKCSCFTPDMIHFAFMNADGFLAGVMA